MRSFGYDQIQFIFVPSCDEVREYEGSNSYSCGLDETRISIEKLSRDAYTDFNKNKGKSQDPHFSSPRFGEIRSKIPPSAAGANPDVIFQVIALLTSGGMGAAVFKLLEVWVNAKNGRKIIVDLPSGIKVDATQLKHNEFSKLLEDVYKVYIKYEKEQGFLESSFRDNNIKTVTEDEMMRIRRDLLTELGKKSEDIQTKAQKNT